MIAIDTNLLAGLWLPSERTVVAEKIYYCDPVWIAPLLWRSEFRNVVSLYVAQGVSFQEGLESIQLAEEVMKGREYEVNSAEVMRLMRHSGCTAYDCEFVYVAQLKAVPLITFDSQILSQFPEIAIDPHKFIQEFS